MNPKISIVVDTSNKAVATITGMATVGAKIDLEISGLPTDIPDWGTSDKWTGKSLRFRIVDELGRDLARYPLKEYDSSTTPITTGDTWTVSAANVYTTTDGCYLECDTEGLREAFKGVPFNERLELGLILDSSVDSAQYAVGYIKMKQWLVASTEDPTVLPNWREVVERIDNASASVTKSGRTATISITDTHGTTTSATVSDGTPASVVQVLAPDETGTNKWHYIYAQQVDGKWVLALDQNASERDVSYIVPQGGTTGQMLAKKSASDYDVEWTTTGAGDVIGATMNSASVTKLNGVLQLGTVLTDASAFDAAGAATNAITTHLSDTSNQHVTEQNKTDWNAAKTHAEITSGNPHGVTYDNIGGTKPSYTASEVGALPDSTTHLSGDVKANMAITGDTKCKITYDAKGLVTGGENLTASDIPNLDASKITSGTLADARIPSLNASKITSGTLSEDRLANASNWNTAYSQTHTHSNKATIDKISAPNSSDNGKYLKATVSGGTTSLSWEASDAPSAYLKSVAVSGNTATFTKQDDTTETITAAKLGAVAANNAIASGTATKVTYDAKGLVTSGASLTANDIPNLNASKITNGTFADARIASASTWNAKQSAITSSSKLSSDLVDDTNHTNKFITAAQASAIDVNSAKVSCTELTVSGFGFTKNAGTVTSVSAGNGLAIGGTASTSPIVNVASDYKLPTTSEWNGKQDVLVGSGEGQNIKTINNETILGSGNITTVIKTAIDALPTNPTDDETISVLRQIRAALATE